MFNIAKSSLNRMKKCFINYFFSYFNFLFIFISHDTIDFDSIKWYYQNFCFYEYIIMLLGMLHLHQFCYLFFVSKKLTSQRKNEKCVGTTFDVIITREVEILRNLSIMELCLEDLASLVRLINLLKRFYGRVTAATAVTQHIVQ